MLNPGTNLYDPTTGNHIALTDEIGNVTLCKYATANIPSGVKGYAVGCKLVDTTTGLSYSNTGTATSCAFTPVNTITSTSVIDPSIIQTAVVPLTSAQIKALFTTSVVVIPAIAGKAIILDSFVFDLTGTATQYTGGGVVNLQYDSTANGAGTTLHADIAATVVTGATARVVTVRIPKDLSAIATTAIVGKGVYIGAKTADFAAGTGTANLIVTYHTI